MKPPAPGSASAALIGHLIGPGARILVLRPGALGDTLLALPAIRALRGRVGPMGRIELLGYPSSLELACNPLHANCVHSIDRAVFAGLFSEPSSAELSSFLTGYDLVIAWCRDEHGYLRTLLESLGIPYIHSAPFPSEGSRLHAAEHLVGTLEPLGIVGPTHPPELVLTDEARHRGLELLTRLSIRSYLFLAMHPGSGSERKNWSASRFAQIAGLAKRAGHEVLLIAGEADREAIGRVCGRLSWKPPVAANLSLPVLAAVLSRAGAYVGNDSGVTHLAAAVAAPTWALFGPTDPTLWAPRGAHVQLVGFGTEPEALWETIRKGMARGTKGRPYPPNLTDAWG